MTHPSRSPGTHRNPLFNINSPVKVMYGHLESPCGRFTHSGSFPMDRCRTKRFVFSPRLGILVETWSFRFILILPPVVDCNDPLVVLVLYMMSCVAAGHSKLEIVHHFLICWRSSPIVRNLFPLFKIFNPYQNTKSATPSYTNRLFLKSPRGIDKLYWSITMNSQWKKKTQTNTTNF